MSSSFKHGPSLFDTHHAMVSLHSNNSGAFARQMATMCARCAYALNYGIQIEKWHNAFIRSEHADENHFLFSITGAGAYGIFKSLIGRHHIAGHEPNDLEVIVLPEVTPDETNIDISKYDVGIESFYVLGLPSSDTKAKPIGCRMIYKPTNFVVECLSGKTWWDNRRRAEIWLTSYLCVQEQLEKQLNRNISYQTIDEITPIC